MTSGIRVAPREIVDASYRALRVSGSDSGAAAMVARSTAFSVVQFGVGVEGLVGRLDRGEPHPLGVLALAPLGAAGRSAGPNGATPELHTNLENLPSVSDLVDAAFSLGEQGVIVSLVCDDGSVLDPHGWLSAVAADRVVAEAAGRPGRLDDGARSRVERRRRRAMTAGVSVDSTAWSTLLGMAEPYLVPESILDG